MDQRNECYLLFVLMLFPCFVEASEHCSEWLAKVISIQGKVDTQPSGESAWQSVGQEEIFCSGDKIRTSKNSRATIQLRNESRLSLDQGTTMVFLPPEKKKSSWYLDLLEGTTFIRSRQPQRLNIETPFINAVHKGTEFLVSVNSEQTEITVFDGQVAATNQLGEIQIKRGFTGIATKSQPPRVKPLTVRPEDAVQWALYYPPIIDIKNIEQANKGELQSAINAYQQGSIYKALTQLDEVSAAGQNTSYLILKASLLLTVGSVDEALKLIDKVQALEPKNSATFALESVIAVTKNRQDDALNFAQKAVKLNPQSAVAQIALSYAHQSKFNIESALKATQEAVRLSPDNALAWARLSELQLSTDERSDALESAKKAQALNPQLNRTQTILGFAYLAEVDIDEASSTFTEAIKLNSADPLARLGLGLAKIRKGDVEGGTRDLETAVSLDPDNVVMRSYLGKAYYELKNTGYATTELAISKEKDPKDPTPWFYDAILKQTTNRPVDALHDMQKAIELNDNRAVFRSSLLLDEDLAARSASLGRIYNDLDFQQLGLVQGWKSLNIDPGNYSSHRLLADNYAALPRHQVARVSELLQSQLLQPINITPVQPLLSENNLLLLDGLGPSEATFNEFNPLFARNRLALQSSGIFGSNNTWGEEIVQSGLWNNLSYSVGQHHYETDGFRSNNFLKRDLYNVFVQGQLTSDLNLQAEYKYEDRNNGDLSFNFDRTDFSSTLKENRKVATYRIGGRYDLSLNSSLLGSLIYQDVRINQTRSLDHLDFLPPLELKTERNGFIAEMQNIFKGDNYSVITGFSHINQDVGQEKPNSETYPDLTNTTLYSYWSLYPDKQLSVTLGITLNFYKINGVIKHTPVNPKIGLIWKPSLFTTIRATGFRQTSISRTASQTIEPTQVAGFNQLFEDPSGSDTWRYGFAADHIFSPNLYAGLEYSERRINALLERSFFDWKERLGRTYLYWTPYSNIALRMEYLYEKFDREKADETGIVEVKTHKIPLSMSFFHESGASIKVRSTYVNQDGRFLRNPSVPNSEYSGSDSFFLVDANLSYRLPRRYGLITLGMNNLFNQKFNYQNTSIESPLFVPERFLFTRFTIAF